MSMCVCLWGVCMCVREIDRDNVLLRGLSESMCLIVYVCVCVCLYV